MHFHSPQTVPRCWQRLRERGSGRDGGLSTVEVVILAPVVILFILVLVAIVVLVIGMRRRRRGP